MAQEAEARPKRTTHLQSHGPMEQFMLYTSIKNQLTRIARLIISKQHTIQQYKQNRRGKYTHITTSKHNQTDFLTVARNSQIRKTEQDMTEPKYFAAVVQQKTHLTTLTQPRSYNFKPRL